MEFFERHVKHLRVRRQSDGAWNRDYYALAAGNNHGLPVAYWPSASCAGLPPTVR